MSDLRGVLIIFAVLLLGGIYWWGRRGDRKRHPEGALQPSAPAVPDAAEVISANVAEVVMPRTEPTLSEPAQLEIPPAPPPAPPATKIIALRLMAATPRFSGAHLRAALEAEGLSFGKYQIFHRATPQGAIVFSAASMVEPGSFDPEQMFHQQFPGIALFAQLPGASDGIGTLNDLIGSARRLQERLGGVLLDEQGAPLSPLRIEQLRREVREFEAAERQMRPRSESSPS